MFVSCPDCGLSIFVDDRNIDADGQTFVQCPYGHMGCKFFGWVKLKGYM